MQINMKIVGALEDQRNGAAYKGLYILDDTAFATIYGPAERKEIERATDIYAAQLTAVEAVLNPKLLKDVEVIFSGWGCPVINDQFLEAAPMLKAIFYAGGSIRRLADRGQLFDRGIVLTTSARANAIPVAEFCLSQILFSLKLGWHFALEIRERKAWPAYHDRYPGPGCYGATVGLISLGAVSRKLIELLRPFDINILLACDYIDDAEAVRLGARLAGIDEIFERSNVVSLHTAAHEKGVVRGEHFLMMKPRATFINTARGICVREGEMIAALERRPDVIALLDVTHPEPPIPGSELLRLPNVITFPHIAGAMGNECLRLARYAIEDYRRFCRGEKLKYQVTREEWQYLA
jgi:phosphoglycerate dehydrogenase-like enzyme